MTVLVGVAFDFTGLVYYSLDCEAKKGDLVVVNTSQGQFVSTVLAVKEVNEGLLKADNFQDLYKPVVRIASFADRAFYRNSKAICQNIKSATQKQAEELKLGMKVIGANLCLNEDKAVVTFTSDGRVDFRDLVKILGGIFKLRIELRQIGPRDQARLVGGIGACGLTLCCHTFLNAFDGISIAMAKNQLLAINTAKLSGQCGKLMCCLKFENEDYAQIRPLYPKIGEKFTYLKKDYEVTGLNVLSDTITAYNGESYETFTKEEFERVKAGKAKSEKKEIDLDVNSGVDLSGFGIDETKNRLRQIENDENKRVVQQKNRDNQNREKSNKRRKDFNKNRNNYNKSKTSSSSGFIPVSEILDKSILEVKPVKDDDK